MPKLLLVKHAKPLVDPAKSSELWKLSEEGRAQSERLAAELSAHSRAVILSSEEPKAAETAQIIAAKLNIPTESAPGLHEHDRTNVPHMRSGEFIASVELFFRRPTELVLGRETAEQALTRFESAIETAMSRHPDSTVAIISHGTVIALFIAKHSNRNGFQVWREMSLPSFASFDWPEIRLTEIKNRI